VNPTELRQLQNVTLELLSDPRVDDLWEFLANSIVKHEESGRPGSVLRQAFLRGLSMARMRWIDAEGCRLAELQAVSFPAELRSPFPHGLLVFEEPVTAIRVSRDGGGQDVRLDMSGLLWTDVLSHKGHHYLGVYALKEEVLMPSAVEFRPYGQQVRAGAERQAVFANFLPACWSLTGGWVDPDAG
jgi:hypothetical protein